MAVDSSEPHLSTAALGAASTALDRQLETFAIEQGGYVHKFPDGKWSLELEWICTSSLARAAVEAYFANLESADGPQSKSSGRLTKRGDLFDEG
jgi:hypothetical protein